MEMNHSNTKLVYMDPIMWQIVELMMERVKERSTVSPLMEGVSPEQKDAVLRGAVMAASIDISLRISNSDLESLLSDTVKAKVDEHRNH